MDAISAERRRTREPDFRSYLRKHCTGGINRSRATQELQSIPFRHLIGAPLTAIVQAQAQAAQTTIEFIERVGFTPDASDPTKLGRTPTVKFEYNKVSENGTLKDASLEMPVLSIVPIPFIRIESTEINFTANITETETIDVKTSTAVGAETKAAYSSWLSPVRVEFRANFWKVKRCINKQGSASIALPCYSARIIQQLCLDRHGVRHSPNHY